MKWATSVPILIFLGLSVLDLGPMYATDRQTSDVRQKHRLMPPPIRGGCIIKIMYVCKVTESVSKDRKAFQTRGQQCRQGPPVLLTENAGSG